MEFLVVIGLIIWAVASSAKKAQRARETQRQKEVQRQQGANKGQPIVTPARQAAPVRPRVQPTVQTIPVQPAAREPHVVRPSMESGHAHTESSLTGFKPCPPNAEKPLADRLAAYKAAKRAAARTIQTEPAAEAPRVELHGEPACPFTWDPAAVRNGLIYAEILGKPKALRR